MENNNGNKMENNSNHSSDLNVCSVLRADGNVHTVNVFLGKKARSAGRNQEEDFQWMYMCTSPAALAFLSCSAVPQSSMEFGELHYEGEIRE